MAIVRYVGDRITCLQADTKPTSMQDGAIALETDTNKWYQLTSGAWVEIANNTLLDTHTGDTANPHSVTKTQVGLSNVVNLDTTNADNITSGTISSAILPPVALTQVFVAVDEAAMLALATEEGDVVVRSDENKSYMHNANSGGTMADFTLLQTPTDSVLSVNAKTGTVVLNTGDISEVTNLYYTEARVSANVDVVANASNIATHTGDTSNPHSVTKTQVGLGNVLDVAQASQVDLVAHSGNTSNVHQVSLEQARTQSSVLAGDVDFNNNSIDNLSALGFSGGTDITWNNAFKTINIPTGLGPVNQAGQETYIIFYNDSGVQIDDFTVVQITGSTVFEGETYPTVRLAKADKFETCQGKLLVTTMDVPDSTIGVMASFGRTHDVNTSGFTVNDKLYLSATEAGKITNVLAEFPNYQMLVGLTLKVGTIDGIMGISTDGEINDTFINAWNGVFRESIDFIVTATGSTIVGTLEATGGGDLTMIFSDGFSRLDCTPKQEITLTAGTDNSPQVNLIYIDQATKVMAVSLTDWPSTEHIKVANTLCTSVSGTSTYGVLSNRNWNDHITSTDNNGHISHMTERIRQLDASWKSGASGSCTVSGASSSDVFLTVTSGKVFQLHEQTWAALDMVPPGTDDAIVVNHNTDPYQVITNLNTQTTDALGNTLANFSFSFVLWGVQNKTGTQSHMMINLPTGSYAKNDPDSAVSDASNYSVFTIPEQFKGQGFLIARFTYTLASNGLDWVLYNTEDLRGKVPNSTAGGGGGGGAGVTDFLGLTDTPITYTGQALKTLRVNSGENAVEFVDLNPIATSATTLDLSNYNGNYSYMGAASTATTYTTTGQVLGGFAVVRINAASEPTVTGATKIAGSTFAVSTDMHMWVQYFGTTTQFFFAEL